VDESKEGSVVGGHGEQGEHPYEEEVIWHKCVHLG
jgi:hypothetical protein